jgi:hypothetical protein
MVTSMKMAILWVVALYSVVEVRLHFRGACCVHLHPDGEGSKHPWHIGKLLPDCMSQQPSRQPSSVGY